MKPVLCCMMTVLLVAAAAPSQARMPGGAPGFMGPPAFLNQLFMPELIMRYQDEIGLTNEQRDAITQAMADAQKKMVELQWQTEAASKKLGDALSESNIDEAAALAEADRVMTLEQQMKKTHLALLIRIKKVLTPSQQAKLRELRGKEPPRHGPPPAP
jgi:Spy/CpxP family protein refolding chaperone